MGYPKIAKVNGIEYPINTSFNIALKCFEVVNDDSISDSERTLAIIYLLFGFIPDNDLDKFLSIATKYLQCGETTEKQSNKKNDMDFNQDMSYIIASFASDYKINIIEQDMHFYQFVDLIRGLTESCVLSRVREVRNYDLQEIKDPKTRSKMLEAKKNFELKQKINTEDQEVLDEFESLFLTGGD